MKNNMRVLRYAAVSLATLAVCAALLAPRPAAAAAFYLQEHSVSALGAAYAGAATNTQDASVMFYNPAGITELGHGMMTASVVGISARTNLVNTGSVNLAGPPAGAVDSDNALIPAAVPSGYVAFPVYSDTVWAGMAITTPYGLSVNYKDNWFGRYDSITSNLRTYDMQPTLAVRVAPWLSLGGSVDYQRATARLTNAVTNGITEGHGTLNGDDNSWGYTLGATVRPLDHTRIALNYRSQVNHDIKGRVIVTGVAGLNEDSAASAELNLPAQAGIAIAQDIDDRWTVLAQATWFGWKNFHDITAIRSNGTVAETIVENYRNSYNAALGAEYKMAKDWTVRAGYQFDQTPTRGGTRDTRVPDANRNWITAGATYNVSPGINLDLGAAYIMLNKSNIDVTRNLGIATISAHQKSSSIKLLGLGANFKF